MSYDDNYAMMAKQQAECATNVIGQYIPPTDRQKLVEKKMVLEPELDRVDIALKMLDAHPDLEEFTKVLQAALR